MADNTYRFRNALGGFHKGDVIGYIEKAAAQYRNDLLEKDQIIHALREDNRSLQQQVGLLMMATPVVSAPAPAPVIEATSEPAPAPAPEPVPVAAPVSEPESAPTELMSMELQAYRRAEAMERNANNRAQKLYRQLEELCESALGEFQATDSAVKQTIEAMMEQAKSLEESYHTLVSALNASREKLAAMNDGIGCEESEE